MAAGDDLFKVDENLPREVVELMRARGLRAATVGEERLKGSDDERLIEVCRAEGRALVTLDRGFGDIRKYPPRQFAGLVVLRLSRQDKTHVLDVCRRWLPLLEGESVRGKLWIVEDDGVRVRGEPSSEPTP